MQGGHTTIFVLRSDKPVGKTEMYGRVVCDIISQEEETNRVQFTVFGKLITYQVNLSTSTVDFNTINLHCISVIYDPKAI